MSTTPLPIITMNLDAIRQVCKACELSERRERRLACSLLPASPPIGDLLTKGRAFCPEGRHGKLKHTVELAPVQVVEPPTGLKGLLGKIKSGAVGWLTYLTRRCPAPAEIVRFRRSQCASCPQRRRFLGVVSWCGLCGCVLRVKTAIADSECPGHPKRWASPSQKKMQAPCRGLDTLPLVGRFFKSAKGCGCNKANG